MGTIDIIIICCLLPSLYFGIKNGLIRQIISVAVIYLGITLSLRFADPVSAWVLTLVKLQPFWAKAVSFIIIFAAVALVLNLLGNIIQKCIKDTPVGLLNRILGILLSLFIFMLIVSLVVYMVDALNQITGIISEEKIADSKMVPFMLKLAKTFFPYLKSLF